jgi:GTP pyrophosphokinase
MEKISTEFIKRLDKYDAKDRARIFQAVIWAEELCESPITRLLEVAVILADLNLDADTIIAAFLHKSLEENGVTGNMIEEQFGRPVALMVEGITRIAGISAKDKTIQEAENIRKMLFAMVNDIRVIFIKLAVTLYNMRSLDDSPPAERKLIAQECLDIYAPLADRLGISWM